MSNNQSTTIYVVRHGQSEGNLMTDDAVRNVLKKYGESGAPLTDLGRSQAQEVRDKLKNIHFDAIFASHMTRAVQTAEIIAENRSISITTNATIGERHYGNQFWSLTIKERDEMEQGLTALSDEENLHHRFFPDSETEYEAVQRFMKFLYEIIPLFKGKTILVINHGNVMRTFLKTVGWAKYKELPTGAIENTGYFILETDGKTFNIGETWKVHKQMNGEHNEA
jgi:broad specificity phosphatase PhoE